MTDTDTDNLFLFGVKMTASETIGLLTNCAPKNEDLFDKRRNRNLHEYHWNDKHNPHNMNAKQ